jgi:Ser/Thr protein kinase RdoA (MazF antagonist)
MIENNAFLQDVLVNQYALEDVELGATSGGSESDRRVVLVYAGEDKYILRAYPPENRRSNPAALAQVLNLLSEADYPAERVIPAAAGNPVVIVNGWRFVLTSFIEGTPTDTLDSEFYGLGATLGRLHILFTPDELLDRDVPLAERTLDSEMDMARADLLANPRPDSFELAVFYDDLLAAIDAINRCHDLPYTLIHNDFQPGNVLRTPDGSLSVIDWDGSGRSPAIVDLGYLISNIHPAGEARPDAARIHALLDGYLHYSDLLAVELERMADMIRFRPITYLTSDFGNYIANLDHPDPSYVDAIAIYRTADEAANIMRKYWERMNG